MNPWGLLARCGPLSLVGASFVLIAGVPFMDGIREAAVCAGLCALTVAVVVGRTGFPLWRLFPAALAVVSIIWSNWLLSAEHALAPAVVAGLRVAYFVVPGIVFASYLDPFTVGDHLGQRLRMPPRPVLACVAALQRFDDLGTEWADAERVRRVRGLAPGRSLAARIRHYIALVFALFVEAIRKAGRMTIAMEARGYSAPVLTGRPRTWAEPAPWTAADSTLMAIAVVLALAPVGPGLFW
ncbi:Energy-coupling factor transporter transmembrane protein EcfT [Austwickia chelonae]|uniref:ABC transporter permease protein n=1 Tax=Austwickia chelonae NBRC 105200 TaxID=1184607 RepID=K6VSX3_9MICO|nr:energy-coupling factor transporter transmembrane component T [Austwickia chelonae]GAB78445.1 hypothetical protein AUCHE_09_00510 [Austwickia chelonae NBRC 105200]SEW39622.1 Energy-coupling factor transporter transmembrane protein EcfT [Austwickia chelonae]